MDFFANRGKTDPSSMFRISYGLYVVTSNDGTKDNGLIVNTVSQVASSPDKIMVGINKRNYSHDIIKNSHMLNVNCLSENAPFSVFQSYGFRSGRDCDKFEGLSPARSGNGLQVIEEYSNAYLSLWCEQYIDMGSHGMFICRVTESGIISQTPSMTYTYYQNNVKPKPKPQKKKGFVCKVCGYIYEGEQLPPDFICPICKHPASDFEPIELD